MYLGRLLYLYTVSSAACILRRAKYVEIVVKEVLDYLSLMQLILLMSMTELEVSQWKLAVFYSFPFTALSLM